jgi:hypothetical protein
MTNKDIQALIDKYLAGLTSPQEELQLSQALQQQDNLPTEWQAVSLMLGELTLGEAEYEAIIASRKSVSAKPSATLIALRFISSAAALYLVGLFVWLQLQPAPKAEMTYTLKVEQSQPAPQPAYCTEGTPREILMCYIEHRKAQPDTYKQLKQMNYENQ